MAALWHAANKKEPLRLVRQKLPRHIAIAVDTSDQDSPCLQAATIQRLIGLQAKLGIGTLTFNILPYRSEAPADAAIDLIETLRGWAFIEAQDIRIAVLGRWYDLPERLVDSIKGIISSTKENGSYLVNIGINYDGQGELADAMSRIARQVKAQKLDPEQITKETIKMNLDTALLEPPDLIITTGKTFSLRSFMLWDAAHAKIFFSNVPWSDFSSDTLLKALVFHQNTRSEKTKEARAFGQEGP